ncbi:transcription elongation factor GreA [endosymbiont of Pachyrhynchus infernalis]|uniref:transcription elongation factor GreA n=1 Tax=endosymbiont of Pachyrhynchus infernalis TaxID=1971488 RepID=UPI000DC718BC|nr:transcription elongation factor GreA [endosymbiont of Pachyrhynchus infernalis]BBA84949.1 transcription elongation factor GreA [endosymbiont of Pachyrhynchus infernalis]
MTLNGANKLRKELNFLKKISRPKIIQSIIEARKHGDLKENYEYHAAKEQQKLCENRIKNIEIKLLNSKIIDIKNIKNNNLIIFGSTVELENLNSNNKEEYCIVGEEEFDIKNNRISIYSPIAKGLIGKKIGDIVYIQVPMGVLKYKIVNIKYI